MPAHPKLPQHCKQASMEMVRFTKGIQARFPGFQLSSQTGQENGQPISEQKNHREASGFKQPVHSWPTGLGACGQQDREAGMLRSESSLKCHLDRRLCPFTVTEGALGSKKGGRGYTLEFRV